MNIEISKKDNNYVISILETMDNQICKNIDEVKDYILKIDRNMNINLDIFLKNEIENKDYKEILNMFKGRSKICKN